MGVSDACVQTAFQRSAQICTLRALWAVDRLFPRLPALCIILKTFASVKVKTVYVITNGVQWLFIFSVFHEFYLFPLFLFLRSFWGASHTYFCENHSLDCWRAGGWSLWITPAKQHARFSQTLSRGSSSLFSNVVCI